MRTLKNSILCTVYLVGVLTGCASTTFNGSDSSEGYISLFNGQTFEGWTPYTESGEKVTVEDSGFDIQDGLLHINGKGKAHWLATDKMYDNFTLHLECKLTKDANSGIFLRSPGPPEHPAYLGFEVQILDTYGQPPVSTSAGAIYAVLTPMRNMGAKPGEWNEVEVTCNGSLVIVIWNGFKVIDADFAKLTEPIGKWDMAYCDMPKKGRIGLQNHGCELWFRNIRVKPLK